MNQLNSNPTPTSPRNLELADLERIYSTPGVNFTSEAELRNWLSDQGIELKLADSRKGLTKLFEKIQKGEARMVLDEETRQVFRVARAARLEIAATIHGAQYPLVELCQIFLSNPINEAMVTSNDTAEIASLLSGLEIRSAHVRDSQELWETMIKDENPEEGARRGVREELGYTVEEGQLVELSMQAPVIEYEEPIDWPSIPSVLEINPGQAVIPEEISKAAYIELEAGDQITIFVATPGAPLARALLSMVIPKIHYIPSPV